MVLENKQSIAEACRNLGVSRGTMERWPAAESNNHDAEKVRLRQLEDEVRQLRKEKVDMEDTVEILKKRRPSSPDHRIQISVCKEALLRIFCGEDVPYPSNIAKQLL
ncbi:MAG: transposase [Ethanoligenens sp.]